MRWIEFTLCCVLFAGCGSKDSSSTAPTTPEANVVFEWRIPGHSGCVGCDYGYVHNTGSKRANDVRIETSCQGRIVTDNAGEVEPGQYQQVAVAGGCVGSGFSVVWILWD